MAAEKALEKSSLFRLRRADRLGASYPRLPCGHLSLGIGRLLDVRVAARSCHLRIGGL